MPTCVGRRARYLLLLYVPQSPQNLSHCNRATSPGVILATTQLNVSSASGSQVVGLPLVGSVRFNIECITNYRRRKSLLRGHLLFPSVQGRTSLPVMPLRAATESRHSSRPSSFVACDFGDGIARRVRRRQRCGSGSEVAGATEIDRVFTYVVARRESQSDCHSARRE